MWSTMVGISRRPDLSVWLGNFHLADRTEMIALELLLNQRCISFLAQFGKVLYGAFIYSYSTALRIPFGCPIYHSGIFLTGDELSLIHISRLCVPPILHHRLRKHQGGLCFHVCLWPKAHGLLYSSPWSC